MKRINLLKKVWASVFIFIFLTSSTLPMPVLALAAEDAINPIEETPVEEVKEKIEETEKQEVKKDEDVADEKDAEQSPTEETTPESEEKSTEEEVEEVVLVDGKTTGTTEATEPAEDEGTDNTTGSTTGDTEDEDTETTTDNSSEEPAEVESESTDADADKGKVEENKYADVEWKEGENGSMSIEVSRELIKENKEVSFEYKESGFKIIFSELEKDGVLTIEEIKLTEKERKEMNSLSDFAYDVTLVDTDGKKMKEGTFKYDLVFPIAKDKQNEKDLDIKVKYAEKLDELVEEQESTDVVADEKIELKKSIEIKKDVKSIEEVVTTEKVGDKKEMNKDAKSVIIKNLDHFTVFIVTDDNASYSAIWKKWLGTQGYQNNGVHYPTSGIAGETATWNFSSIDSGNYGVYVSWSTHSNRTTAAPYKLTYLNSATESKNINQEQLADQATTGGPGQWSGWYHYGNYNLDTSSKLVLTGIENGNPGEDNRSEYVIADEVLLVRRDIVWVDDGWTSKVNGEIVTVNGDDKYIGYNAFSTIQAGIDQVQEGGKVVVAAGKYEERIVIEKPVELLGATYDKSKKKYEIPANYAWDVTKESVISNPSPAIASSQVVDIISDDVIFKGFVVESTNALQSSGNDHLIRLNATTGTANDNDVVVDTDDTLDNIIIENNIIGPNTNLEGQNGTNGRMGLYFASPNYSDDERGITNTKVIGNKIIDSKGNGNNVFVWGAAKNYGLEGLANYTGTIIKNNDISGSHRSGIEIAGGVRGLKIIKNNIHHNSGFSTDNSENLKYGNGILVIRMSSDKTRTDALGTEGLIIRDNHIYKNQKNGIYFGPINKDVKIKGNKIKKNGWNGLIVDFDENYHSSPTPVYNKTSGFYVEQNRIKDNGISGVTVSAVPSDVPTNNFVLDATNNWWGDASGPKDVDDTDGSFPSKNENGIGNIVVGNVSYCPWLITKDIRDTSSDNIAGPCIPTLEAEYKLDSCFDTAIASDETTNYDGVIKNNPTWVAGYNGQGLQFDGEDDYIDLGDGVDLGTMHTISTWISVDNFNASNNVVFGDSASPNRYALWFANNKKLYYALNGSSDYAVFNLTTGLDTGEWYHIAFVRSDTSVELFVNGASVGTDTLESNNSLVIRNIGQKHLNSKYPFTGKLDEIKFYKGILSDTEIAVLYKSYEDSTSEECVLDKPANLGWNIRSESTTSGERPVDVMCQGITNGDFQQYNNGQVSHNWGSVNASSNIKYQRQWMRPSRTDWETDGNKYSNNHTVFASFGSAVGTEGEWNTRVRAWVDIDGDEELNEANDAISEWSDDCKITYDRTKPTTPIIETPVNEQGFNSQPIRADWTDSVDNSGISKYQVEYIYDDEHTFSGGPYREVSGNKSWRNHTPGVTEQGGVTIRVKAFDNAGNESDWSNAVHYYYDAIAPTTPVILGFKNPELQCGVITNIHNTTVDWTDSIDNESGLKHYNYAVNYPLSNGDGRNDWVTTRGISELSGSLNEGIHHIKVQAEDNAGNKSEWSDVCSITADWTAPEVSVDYVELKNERHNPISIYQDTAWKHQENMPMIVGTTSDLNGVQEIKIVVNGQPYTEDNIIRGREWKIKITEELPEGNNTMSITSTDVAGNEKTITKNIFIDTEAPTAVYKQFDGEVEVTGEIAYVNSLSRLSFTGEYIDGNNTEIEGGTSAGLFTDSYVIFEAQDDGSFRFSHDGKKAFCSWRSEPNLVNISSADTFSLTEKISFANCNNGNSLENGELPDGEYYMTHHVYDDATRKDIPSIKHFRDVLGLHFVVDTQAPVTNQETLSVDTYITNESFKITGTTTDDNGVAGVNVYYKIAGQDDNSWVLAGEAGQTNSDIKNFGFEYIWTPGNDGVYDIKVAGTDIAGNVENSAYAYGLVYDVTKPTVNQLEDKNYLLEGQDAPIIAATGADNHGLKEFCATITGPESKFLPGGIKSSCVAVEAEITEYTWKNVFGFPTVLDTSMMPEGIYTVEYYTVDNAGNTSQTPTGGDGEMTCNEDESKCVGDPIRLEGKKVTYTLANVAPAVNFNYSYTKNIDENDKVYFWASFTDPSSNDAGDGKHDDQDWTATIDYGDGKKDVFTMSQPGAIKFVNEELDHRYEDNGEYTPKVTVCESATNPSSERICTVVELGEIDVDKDAEDGSGGGSSSNSGDDNGSGDNRGVTTYYRAAGITTGEQVETLNEDGEVVVDAEDTPETAGAQDENKDEDNTEVKGEAACKEGWPLWAWLLVLLAGGIGTYFIGKMKNEKVILPVQAAAIAGIFALWYFVDGCGSFKFVPYADVIGGFAIVGALYNQRAKLKE